jgi:hypothetical protein
VTEPTPAEILRRARPVPTYRDHPATVPHDVVGVDPEGAPVSVSIIGSAEPVLLLFLSADCLGCRDLWEGLAVLGRSLPTGVGVVVVTHDPAREDSAAIAALAPASTTTVMSSQAFGDYRVGGPPFFVLVTGNEVLTEGVAWGTGETARAAGSALGKGMSQPSGMVSPEREGHDNAGMEELHPRAPRRRHDRL